METTDQVTRPADEDGSTTVNLAASVDKADAHTKLKLMRDVMIGPIDQLVDARNEKMVRDLEIRERNMADRVDGLESRIDGLEKQIKSIKEKASTYHGQALSEIGDSLSGLSEKLRGLRERVYINDLDGRH